MSGLSEEKISQLAKEWDSLKAVLQTELMYWNKPHSGEENTEKQAGIIRKLIAKIDARTAELDKRPVPLSYCEADLRNPWFFWLRTAMVSTPQHESDDAVEEAFSHIDKIKSLLQEPPIAHAG